MGHFPVEVDVYSEPHIRMKKLVDEYLKKLTLTDFTDIKAVRTLLPHLQRTFSEFKSHENIENYYIMNKLQARLKELSVNSSAVCNRHSDSRLSEILSLMEDGYRCCTEPSEFYNYGCRLRRILSDFTDNFLPHMREEEEVVQPLLIKYFDYEELKSLKITVLQRHTHWEERQSCGDESNPFSSLPMEMKLTIFSYLSQLELLQCSRVCRQWNQYLFQPPLWHNLDLPQMLAGFFKRKNLMLKSTRKTASCLCLRTQMNFDADHHQKEMDFLSGMITYLLPVIGDHVQHLVLSWVENLTALQLRAILVHCPNVQHMDFSGTNITDVTFESMNTQTFNKLSHLDMSGCCNITDTALIRIATVWQTGWEKQSEPRPTNSGLLFLSLSGCHRVTDAGISSLSKCGLLNPLVHLDLSGCHLITGIQLQCLVTNCTKLQAERISYCNNVDGGPCDANGCNNLGSRHRFCCSYKQF